MNFPSRSLSESNVMVNRQKPLMRHPSGMNHFTSSRQVKRQDPTAAAPADCCARAFRNHPAYRTSRFYSTYYLSSDFILTGETGKAVRSGPLCRHIPRHTVSVVRSRRPFRRYRDIVWVPHTSPSFSTDEQRTASRRCSMPAILASIPSRASRSLAPQYGMQRADGVAGSPYCPPI